MIKGRGELGVHVAHAAPHELLHNVVKGQLFVWVQVKEADDLFHQAARWRSVRHARASIRWWPTDTGNGHTRLAAGARGTRSSR